MYPPPDDALHPETARKLDDEFFTSDPYAYIRSRIQSLLSTESQTADGPLVEEFARLLGPSASRYTEADARVRSLQIAVDAFALRHQVAESLLRLLHVVLHHQDGASHWVELTDTPIRTREVVKDNRRMLDAQDDGGTRLMRAALAHNAVEVQDSPDADGNFEVSSVDPQADEPSSPDLVDVAVETHIQWIKLANAVFTQTAPDVDAAHNKFKHGIGIRPQDDVLAKFLTTGPRADGGIPLSAFSQDRSVTVFGGHTMQFLARETSKHGLELTQLTIDPARLLSEAAAIAHTFALIFDGAARRHFSTHEPPTGRSMPEHPGFLIGGPVPGSLRPYRPCALRFALTRPLRTNGSPDPLLMWPDGTGRAIHFVGETTSAVIVADDEPDGGLHSPEAT